MKSIILIMLLALPILSMAQEVEEKKETQEIEVLTFAEQMPDYPGGVIELYRFIATNVEYPAEMKQKKIETKVAVNFVIDTLGKISDIRFLNNPPQPFIDETIRVIKLMPNWIPGMQDGKLVNVVYTLPISFRLN